MVTVSHLQTGLCLRLSGEEVVVVVVVMVGVG